MDTRFKNWLIHQLRRLSFKHPGRGLKHQSREKQPVGIKGKDVYVYPCQRCGAYLRPKELKLDHIVPVIDPGRGFITWDSFIERLFCEPDGFQVLCSTCHKKKTEEENFQRKELKMAEHGNTTVPKKSKKRKSLGKRIASELRKVRKKKKKRAKIEEEVK